MTYIKNTSVSFQDSANIDAFGRLRTSDAVTLFDSQCQYDSCPSQWFTELTNGGTSTHI